MSAPVARLRVFDQVVTEGRHARRRRPSGEVAPLPRPIYTSGRVYISLGATVMAGWTAVLLVAGFGDFVDTLDRTLLRALERARVEVLVDTAAGIQELAGDWPWRLVLWATITAGLAFRRLRHVAVLCGLVLVITALTTVMVESVGRLPPDFVVEIGAPERYTHPSRPVVQLGLALVGWMYVLFPRGRPRNRAKIVVAAIVVPFIVSRLYLGLDHPTDVAVALVVGMAVPVVAFRFLVPNDAFPIVYSRTEKHRLAWWQAHAIRESVASQLAWNVSTVWELQPPNCGGSTPLHLRLAPAAEDEPAEVFAKLYSLSHLRADRWYKLARAIIYGRLEDEAPFTTVRQLVEHEDYLLRVAAAEGLPVPRSFGLLELSSGRDYLLLLEMLPDACQLGDEPVGLEIVDQGLELVARLWAAGIAHRDVKPGNLVVSRGRLFLVDLSFGEVAPTPWRLAIDLANMMLCLGLYTEPRLVYERALQWFRPDEIGEAFATARSVTIPAQLRRLLRLQDPDLLERFRALAPVHDPISIQRWSVARLLLTAAVAAVALGGAALLAFNLETVGLL